MMTMQMDPRAFNLRVSKEVSDLLTATAHPMGMTAAVAFSQAIDELEQIEPSDYDPGSGPLADKQFKIEPAQYDRTTQMAAGSGISEHDVAIAAIRQYAKRHRP
jgi:predicted HicB family RNase H-like nuclease